MPLDYITIGCNDFARARAYYDPVMAALGAKTEMEIEGRTVCYAMPGGGRLWVGPPYDGKAASAGNGITIGLRADAKDKVDAAHAAALTNGGSNEGDPGPRPLYGPGFYGGYARDPDGNKMSFVHLTAEHG